MVTILSKIPPSQLGNWRSDRTWYGRLVAKIGKGAKVRYLRSFQVARGRSDKSKRITRHAILAASVLVLVWSITGVKLMLDRKSITNINSLAATGQLIPFIIGVATVAKLAFNTILKEYKSLQLI
ncbi:hypothetical protein BKA64DRAFT_261852 [Cadophora sp. MPI-SDFR-AT-0126]|nr:hypothetical protein BKA64DRAFT_261852 [Leotiomycetes sp. MPI-SDFR-AT-0126]